MNGVTVLSYLPFIPLLGAALAYWAGHKNRNAAGPIATFAAAVSFAAALLLTFTISIEEGGFVDAVLFRWFDFGVIGIDFAFRFDHLTSIMCLVITGIGSLIHLYSIGYMAEDPSRHRFFAYLNLFLFSMLLLVLGKNLLVMFVGWEGVGLCSYLLIGFWYKNLNYAAAGRKAFVVNRIGDAAFLIGMFILLKEFRTLDFAELKNVFTFSNVAVQSGVAAMVALCLFIGATGKSAQIPLFVWLPDAMAGPTPVSALIHAATMVTAGVYLSARMQFLFDMAPSVMAVVALVGVATAFVAATIAVAQNDIKKVLAYSTVSQLGFMFIGVSVGAYNAALFHLVTHAFFKACLFLGAGSVIHGCHHEQDMRKMGGLFKLMPVTALTYGISTLAIAGIYPFSGYQSKHAILGALSHSHNPYLHELLPVLIAVASFTAFLTAFYMTRSFAMTFIGGYRGDSHHTPHESPVSMTVPLVVLASGAMLSGILLSHTFEAGHGETIIEALMHSWVGILGIIVGFIFFQRIGRLNLKLLSNKYYIDEIYGFFVVKPLEVISNALWKGVDVAAIDGTVNGMAAVVELSGEASRSVQTGQTRYYALLMFLGILFLVVFYLVL